VSDDFDLAVIGGGIHGCGVAQAGAAAGYRVLLLEQEQLAFGTSRRSSKLIHGGLRYLESAQIALVRESLRERELLLKLAPELVQRRDFYLPVYRETSRRPWKIWLGLATYSALAGFRAHTGFKRLPSRTWRDLDGLRTDGLQQLFCYSDAQTNDAALTRAVMASARELGAELQCPAEFIGAERSDEGCSVEFRDNQGTHRIQCKVLINAAGPWVNEVLSRVKPDPSRLGMDLVQGTHIVLPGEIARGIYYVEAPADRRAVFVMPWEGKTLVGTTESFYTGDPAKVQPLPREIDYLRETFRHYFPDRDDTVVDSFAGLRVLPAGDGVAFGKDRETRLHADVASLPRVLTIYGGKLTGYRATAEKVVEAVRPGLGKVSPVASTAALPLHPA
jgi:glycerol-3-phosphate dehydrogenase